MGAKNRRTELGIVLPTRRAVTPAENTRMFVTRRARFIRLYRSPFAETRVLLDYRVQIVGDNFFARKCVRIFGEE